MKTKIRKITWEKIYHPEAKWVVISGEDRTTCETFFAALRYWFWHIGISPKISFCLFKKKRYE